MIHFLLGNVDGRQMMGHLGALMFFLSMALAALSIPTCLAYTWKMEGNRYWYVSLLLYIPVIGLLLIIIGAP